MPVETDRERIIRAIGCCISDPDGKRACDKCPYGEAQANGRHCQNLMHNDAIELLKEQEAEIRQLRLALDIAKGTCNGIKVEGR